MTRRPAVAALAWGFRRVHAAYQALAPASRTRLQKLWPQWLRTLARRRLVPLLNRPLPYQPVARASSEPQITKAAIGDLDGATLVGYLHSAFGVAESFRGVARAFARAGVPFDILEVPVSGRAVQVEAELERHVRAQPRHATQVFGVNADGMLGGPAPIRRALHPGKYRIARWFWELSEFPAEWRGAFDEVDELWASSPFIEEALAAVSPKPVLYMPQPVEFSLARAYTRADFGLPRRRFLALFIYDAHSFIGRKNPMGAIDAFQRAFAPSRQDAGLVIKTLEIGARAGESARLRERAAADARITVLDHVMTRDEIYGLQSVCDVFLSLHRAEGFGLALAEAMLLGKPVVATGYSGNLAFMNPSNSCLVDYGMVPVGEGAYLLGEGKTWAEPDIAHAAEHLRRLQGDPAYAGEIGERAARTIREQHSHAVTGARMRARLELIAARRRAFAARSLAGA